MPPKKKGGKKKGGKEKGAKKEPPPPNKIEEEPLSELSKEFYLIQIRDLEERVARYQLKCDHLQTTNETLQKKLTQQLEDQEHIIALLNKKIQEQTEQFAELDDQLVALRHEKETERERLMSEISAIREEAQDRLDQLTAENTVLHATLDSLEEFKVNKEKLESELKSKQERIEELKKEFDEKIYSLEKQAVLDKDRLRKEMVSKVNSVASEFRKVSDLQMADTTKRTIQENMSIGRQLHRMSDKTTELMKENERLKEREKELCRRMEIMEATERDVTRKNITNQRFLEILREKIQEQEAVLSEHSDCHDEILALKNELEQAQFTTVTLTQQAEAYKSSMKGLDAELKEVHKAHEKTKDEVKSLKALLQSATFTLKSTLMASPEDETNRDPLVVTLLDLLKAAPNGRTGSKNQIGGITSYKPGDLGLVPGHLPPLQCQPKR
ncbi:PREDICTED: cilia- and flagella-associated protein 157-like [Amphimedon queenslandica]|uniref:Cilia- and flagella-associated protein 157 n=1 Tax=Amphimedon queenslandica TaxID=400682 RepID=A0A1X7V3T5_AMPQE|nr:PREDICTED: cilia- and flagella-associated protein 157-like [Amphimedon queenslandica]|eukprot:XP_003385936.1 PREDICTED: cilia- and flagella-associated protein 157-like [Amphimedon queenslandica]